MYMIQLPAFCTCQITYAVIWPYQFTHNANFSRPKV